MAWLQSLRLKSKDPHVRSKAVENLNATGKTRDTDRIFASLSDPSPEVRCAAIRVLEKAHNDNSAQSLIQALQDTSFHVRESAAKALGRLKDVGSIQPLVNCLIDAEPSVRTSAALALQALGWMPITEEQLTLFNIALGTPNISNCAGTDGDPFVAEPLLAPSFQESEGQQSDDSEAPENLRLFLAGLGDSNPGVRVTAIRLLARVPGQEVTRRLVRLFRDRDPSVKLAAVQALAQRDDPAPAFFLGLIDDPSPAIRLAAVQFLGRIHHAQIAEGLFPLLSDAEPRVREATASALGAIGDACAVESLVLSLIDEDATVRAAAERSLEQIDPNWLLSSATQIARIRIETTLGLCSPEARASITQVLARLPAPAVEADSRVQVSGY